MMFSTRAVTTVDVEVVKPVGGEASKGQRPLINAVVRKVEVEEKQ